MSQAGLVAPTASEGARPSGIVPITPIRSLGTGRKEARGVALEG